MRELTYYISVSLDGRISGPGDDFSHFLVEGDHMDVVLGEFADALPTHVLDALGVTPPGDRFDTVLMGWNTFAVGLPQGVDSPYRHLHQVVFARTPGRTVGAGVELTGKDPAALARELKSESGSGIWLCGGGRLASALASEIDRLVLKVHPVVLGAGPALFDGGFDPGRWQRERLRAFDSGVTIAEYCRR